MTAFVQNTNLLELTALTDETDASFINNATVQATIYDAAGAQVSGISWPVTLDYVAASNGNYRAVISDALALVHSALYTATVTADAGASRKGKWDFKFRAQTRR